MTKCDRRIASASATILIPCVLGIVGMAREGVPVGIWMQNPMAIAVLAFGAMAAGRLGVRLPARVVVIASVLLLGLTFLGQGIDGVHRWLRLPGFTLNAAAVALPACVAALTRLAGERQTAWVSFGIGGIALLLCLQPDASQLLAFSLPMIALLTVAALPKGLKLGGPLLLAALTLLSWLHLDHLPPVSYTEGILAILRGQSAVLYAEGILALLWVPVRFMVGESGEGRRIALSVALYYAMMILASFLGNFPVPFMGYGVSPILGCYIMMLPND